MPSWTTTTGRAPIKRKTVRQLAMYIEIGSTEAITGRPRSGGPVVGGPRSRMLDHHSSLLPTNKLQGNDDKTNLKIPSLNNYFNSNVVHVPAHQTSSAVTDLL